MKKVLASILLLSLFFPLGSFAAELSDFQSKLYCKVADTSVRVYLQYEKDTLKCGEYLTALNVYLNGEYRNMLQLLKNLGRGDDQGYWKQVYTEKKTQFLKLFDQKTLIQTAMNDFEAALLKQVKQFLWIELLEKQALLEELITDTQKKIDAHPSYQLHESLVILKQKQEVIEQVLTANTMDIFMKYFTQYLTLVPSQQEGK